MSPSEQRKQASSPRREPPPFRAVSLIRREQLSPRMIRVTLGGPALDGLVVGQPAASVRLLLPNPGSDRLVVPAWNGNEFLLADGTRPIIRTFTPRRFDGDQLQIDLDMVIHDGGIASGWATDASVGAEAAISGTGRGYVVNPDAAEYVLAGDETAIPAISQLMEVIPPGTPTQVHIEVTTADAQLALPPHPSATVDWYILAAGTSPGGALIEAVRGAEFGATAKLWCAGEAAGVQAVRQHVFKERGFPRSQATIRGYWRARPT